MPGCLQSQMALGVLQLTAPSPVPLPGQGPSCCWVTTRLTGFPRLVTTRHAALAITGVGSRAGRCHQPSLKVVLLEHVKPALLLKLSCPGKLCALFAFRSVLVPSLSPLQCPLGSPWCDGGSWRGYRIFPPFLSCRCIHAW